MTRAPLVRLELDENRGIAVVQLCDERDKNLLGSALVQELTRCLTEVAHHRDLRVCLLRGLSDVFCAGGHPDMLLALASGKADTHDIPLLRSVLDLPVPAIAALEGHAVGGGLMLGLCCDIVLLAGESRYGCPFTDLGFTPGAGATRLLAEAIGPYRAAELLYGGAFVRGADFAERSAVNRVLPRAQVWQAAVAMAERIAEKPRHVLILLKRQLALARRLAFEEAQAAERTMLEVCFARPETSTRIEAEFLRPLERAHHAE